MDTLTPAEQYAATVPILERGVADLLAREESAAAELEQGIATVVEALTTVATAYVERARAVQGERAAAIEAAGAINGLAARLGVETRHKVPASRIDVTGPAGAVHRATSRGVLAVVFELAAIVAERTAKEM